MGVREGQHQRNQHPCLACPPPSSFYQPFRLQHVARFPHDALHIHFSFGTDAAERQLPA
jgi:hypothetical protein